MSPRTWRRLIKPELARIVAAVKEAGGMFFLHSCGRIMEIVPDLIEIGVDVLDPIQAGSTITRNSSACTATSSPSCMG